jgi:hypothetical protein
MCYAECRAEQRQEMDSEEAGILSETEVDSYGLELGIALTKDRATFRCDITGQQASIAATGTILHRSLW